jgi:hypothetical protein
VGFYPELLIWVGEIDEEAVVPDPHLVLGGGRRHG